METNAQVIEEKLLESCHSKTCLNAFVIDILKAEWAGNPPMRYFLYDADLKSAIFDGNRVQF